ncbi:MULTISPECIES: type II toxin-antitoxin system Phd/YefM family antitoxin [Corynebacterium]|nr:MULTISPECIES: type II toxin-antitoxin system Phd/YefM family antitoxin [Corynebacterium]MCT1443099.1 type II toxin-antitoxin system Phd/YefM family antitoxin [Corynebacterium glucuronolyticum]MCT1563421.1 type II toxin-antitoxin system Phd/YefM family antitoxin [Corynebacterium glucuronolyticum]OFO49276.1 prevent-host-death protein [Corynebacterium sp. HMSC073D01]QQU88726.1 type II toxin-antitoxin system Phd/YefM family antitoxin [Corynebacterium glucuronolyticum]QRP70390.1 type II toxin-an
MVRKRAAKKSMKHINIGDLGRGQASKLLKEVADGDDVAYVLRYGKPLVVVMSHERYERLMEDGVDPNEH